MPREKKPQVKRRKDGRFLVKYKGQFFYSPISSDDAYAQRDEYKRQQELGIVKNVTVAEYGLPWLKRTYPKVADSTKAGLAIHLQHLIDEIGKKQISKVVPSDIKNVYSNQYKDCSNSYLKAAKQLFSALFDSAVADGLCRSNPARDRTAKPHKGNDVKTRPITPQEREWINTYCHDHRAFPAVITMLYAGIRPQEAKALDIGKAYDKEKVVLHITETAHRDGNNQYQITEKGKTANATRDVPVFPPVAEVLEGRSGLLITTAKGKQITKTTWDNAFASYKTCMETAINGCHKRWYRKTKEHKKILAEAEKLRKAGKKKEAEAKEGEIPPWIEFTVIPYDLRHSFCTMCRDSGVEINTCRKWMGHADAKMILKVYDSVSEDRSENERKKVEKQLFGSQNGSQKEISDAENVEK